MRGVLSNRARPCWITPFDAGRVLLPDGKSNHEGCGWNFFRGISMDWRLFTELVRLTGQENIGLERALSSLLGPEPVNSPSPITLENNEKIRPQPDRENAFAKASGGEGGIRTHGTREGSTVFETAPFDHSGTSPRLGW